MVQIGGTQEELADSLSCVDGAENPGGQRQLEFKKQSTKEEGESRDIQNVPLTMQQYTHYCICVRKLSEARKSPRRLREMSVSTHTGLGIVPFLASQLGKPQCAQDIR